MSFQARLQALVAPLDPVRHAQEIETLRRCRGEAELDHIAQSGGWLSPEGAAKRLKLLRHGSGTYLVVEYDDGWSTRLSQA